MGMDESTGNEPDQTGTPDTGEVPEQQLHRWKGEGGAPPPEPKPEPEPESGSAPEAETDNT